MAQRSGESCIDLDAEGVEESDAIELFSDDDPSAEEVSRSKICPQLTPETEHTGLPSGEVTPSRRKPPSFIFARPSDPKSPKTARKSHATLLEDQEPCAKRTCLVETDSPPWQRAQAVGRKIPNPQAPLALLLVSLDERFMAPPQGFSQGQSAGGSWALDLHGVTKDGASVLLHVHGFRPYFYATRPKGSNPETCCQALNQAVRTGAVRAVEYLEPVERLPLMHYQEQQEQLYRLVVASQKLIGPCKSALEKGINLPGGILWQSSTFESNVPLPLRFLSDVGASGGRWVEVPSGRYMLRSTDSTSTAQIEADADWRSLQCHKAEGEWLGLAPLRLLSLHVRTVGSEGRIAAAGAVLQVHGQPEQSGYSISWSVADASQGDATSSAMEGTKAAAHVVASETELLTRLRDFVLAADPDILLGYDLLNCHLASVISRATAKQIGASHSTSSTGSSRGVGYCLGRLRGVASRVKSTSFETRQLGKHETKDINIEGRLLIDVLTILEREKKLSSYSLSALALEFLSESRMELRAPDVERLSRENPVCLAQMALQDARLAMRLFSVHHILFRYVEMARVTGVPMEYLLTRGQSVKVLSMLLRKAKDHGYVLPPQTRGGSAVDEEGNGNASYEGGAVLEPLAGFYDEPVVTLDFASLYPSIMMKHNLCYSTLLRPGAPDPTTDGANSVEVVPTFGHRFVTARVRQGLVPMILEELLHARAKAKKELKQAAAAAGDDQQLQAVLDGRQLALKLSANSVYGFTGMSVGFMPCQDIAASVTAHGRRMIERAKEIVENSICLEGGKERTARVIYGDTDSVMLTLGRDCPMQRAFELGKEAADLVSEAFGAPVKMEFEKVYQPFLLMNKKRYAGLAWQTSDKPGKLDFKGIEVVRRDWCLLVRSVVERSLELLLKERSPEGAMSYVRETVAALRSGRVDFRLLVISKALVRNGAEAYAARQAHVELAEKLRLRNPLQAPKVGDRIPYVFVARGSGANACERAEDPLQALEDGLPLDADYYVEHQLKQPLLRVFEPVLGGSRAEVEKRLFGFNGTGRSPALPSRSSQAGKGTMAAFVQRRSRCMAPGCRALTEGKQPLCPNCVASDRMAETTLAQLDILRPLEAETSRLLSHCLRCEGSLCRGLNTLCSNIDCPIFFRRRQASTELQAATEGLKKLQLDW
eukprot:TRINITY_DN32204_c0_g1_i1.p1 TRINITY_DN32204_c0_g1~~TRINITY_DN32204_c0_g1_i1.p1  ORF type:complete len:1167 (-),score=199.65 TRINITY_DN32204_c0_g1_i1:258-3758(-)